jgi:glycosyltransferase involved in cell wall biosynthesis
MRVAVILSTFDQPEHLRRALAGYRRQQRPPDELLVADDGSGEATRAVIREFAAQIPFPVRHCRHDHDGWRKNAIVNRAIAAARADYVIVSDGDCIPRPDFIAAHLRNARPGRFLAGGDYRLPETVTDAVTADDILSGAIFRLARLRELGLPVGSKTLKLTAGPRLGAVVDRLNLSPARWGGSNASTWREALLRVNGLDERFSFPGKDDVEMGTRLRHLGLRAWHVRHQAVCLHLFHGKGYWRFDEMEKNLALLNETISLRRTATPCGIAQAATGFTIDECGAAAS